MLIFIETIIIIIILGNYTISLEVLGTTIENYCKLRKVLNELS
jgi:hypothetical protein